MPNSTIRKFLCGVSVGSLLILGISTRAHSGSPAKWSQAQSEKQTQQPTKSVAGKVAAIGSSDANAFPMHIKSGETPACSAAHIGPVRPYRVNTSSKTRNSS